MTAITGTTICYPLVGHPVEQVRTPPGINAYFARAGIDAVMFPADIEPGSIETFFGLVRAWSNCGGCSVTIPHKQAAFRAMDRVSERARLAGAVNIFRREPDGALVGDMTDGEAFVAALSANGIAVAGRTVLVVGAAGGAGGAIAHALCEAGARELHLVDLKQGRLEELGAALAHNTPGCRTHIGWSGAPVDLAVNATPLGMRPEDPLPFDPGMLPSHAAIADVVTEPNMTPLLKRARAEGRAISTGYDMADSQLERQMRYLGLWRGEARPVLVQAERQP